MTYGSVHPSAPPPQNRRPLLVILGLLVVVILIGAMLAITQGGPDETAPTASSTSSTTKARASSSPSAAVSTSPSASAAATGPGKVVGSAVMEVSGTGRATITWRENDGPEHVERDVVLPWNRRIQVIEHAVSGVKAQGGDMCVIKVTAGGLTNGIGSFDNKANPVCSFSYYE
ncbi:hypothetical protein [Mycobacterium sp. NPDC050853]|uniref:hypothetical protein n=1 Tax=Mycobacteriaceae TaxID=1762 RepID=UPI0015DFD986|nr:hypothetical protein [Mycobacteroides sp. LB1]